MLLRRGRIGVAAAMLVITAVMVGLICPTGTASAARDKIKVSPAYYCGTTGSGDTQFRFILVTKGSRHWTPWKYVAGQPRRGTYLRKGSALYYGQAGGAKATMSVGFGCYGSISFSVPIGRREGVSGTILPAHRKGYYKIKARKQGIVKAQFIQWRHRRDGHWSKWSKAKLYRRLFRCERVRAELVRVPGR